MDQFGNPRIWAREICFNTLLAFGEAEGWVCDEYHSWNCEIDQVDSTFEDWKDFGYNTEDSIIHEFNLMDFTEYDTTAQSWPDYATKYHDTYVEYHTLLKAIRNRFPMYEILLIEYPLRDYGLVAKEDGLFFLNLQTGKMLTDFPIDNCRADFNGAGIQLFKGKESAFFSRTGKQMTDFRVGTFSWTWDIRPDHIHGKIITDHATGKSWHT